MLNVKLKFAGKCEKHPRYNPEKDGQAYKCPKCEKLWVIYLYANIARKHAEEFTGGQHGT